MPISAFDPAFKVDGAVISNHKLGPAFTTKLQRGFHDWECEVNTSGEAIAKLGMFVAALKASRD